MSMNHAEIDLVLEELDLAGAHVQNIWQPVFDTLVMEFYRPGGSFMVRICMRSGLTRIHRSTRNFPTKGAQPRFAVFLRTHLKGAHVTSSGQIGRERIVALGLRRENEDRVLYIRLWGNAGNAFLCSPDGTILDCAYRRPQRNEMSGGRFALPEPQGPGARDKLFAPRSHEGHEDLSAFLDEHYARLEREERLTMLRAQLERNLAGAENRAMVRLSAVKDQLGRIQDPERFKYMGDLLTSQLHLIRPGMKFLETADWYGTGETIRIELEPERSPAENARRWYQKYQKAKDSRGWLEQSKRDQERLVAEIRSLQEKLSMALDLEALQHIQDSMGFLAPQKQGAEEGDEDQTGVRFIRGGFLIMVGRNANENDHLLRREARGNDLWVHARDYPGSHVFIKVPKGKSVPLEVLLDAAHLAVWYSKAKDAVSADVYYTQTKYLRRVKDGPKGLVIPTQEKNLHVRIDKARLDAILKAP